MQCHCQLICEQTFKKAEDLESRGAGQDEEFVGQHMTAFTAGLWRNLERLAPDRYNLTCDRNKKPNRSTSDAKPTEVRTIFHDHCCQRRGGSPHMQTRSLLVRMQHDHNIARVLLRGFPPRNALALARFSALCTCSHPFRFLALAMHKALVLA